MAAAVEDDFESWLSLKLQELNTDEGVFGSYIKGILDGDESLEEKTEALEGILAEITEADIGKHCREIVDRWNSSQLIISCSSAKAREEKEGAVMDDVEQKLVKLLETNAPTTLPQREYTDEERRIRQAILAQYSQTSDKDSDDEGGGGGGGVVVVSGSEGVGGGGGGSGKGKENCLFRNTNAAAVQQAEKEKREKAKIDSQKKKEKDREDREKQKQLQQEKKEKRKTQKGERRR